MTLRMFASESSDASQSLESLAFRSNATSVPWSNGNDTSLTKRKRGFDSLRDDWVDDRWKRWSVGVPGRIPLL